MAESDEKLNSLLMRVKEESKKVGLKLNIQKWYGIWSHHFMANRRGKSRSSDRFSFLRLQNHWAQWLQPWNLKMSTPWKESYDKPGQRIKKQTHHFSYKGPSSQGYGFSSSHVWMWELAYKESWGPKNWCFWTVVLEKTLESPLDCKETQPVHSKDQTWLIIGRTDVEAETPKLWPPDVKNWLIWKDSDAGKYWGQEDKGTIEDEMVGWHHQLNRQGFG